VRGSEKGNKLLEEGGAFKLARGLPVLHLRAAQKRKELLIELKGERRREFPPFGREDGRWGEGDSVRKKKESCQILSLLHGRGNPVTGGGIRRGVCGALLRFESRKLDLSKNKRV